MSNTIIPPNMDEFVEPDPLAPFELTQDQRGGLLDVAMTFALPRREWDILIKCIHKESVFVDEEGGVSLAYVEPDLVTAVPPALSHQLVVFGAVMSLAFTVKTFAVGMGEGHVLTVAIPVTWDERWSHATASLSLAYTLKETQND